ncbi:hypothetical protein ACVWXO_006264 [Bradyrhizobium sp. LM2.7]
MSGSCAATNGLASRHRARGKTPARLQDQSIEGLALPIVTPIAGISRKWRAIQDKTTNSYVIEISM